MTIDLSKLSEVPREHLELWFRYTWSHAAFKVEGPLADKLSAALTPKLRTRAAIATEALSLLVDVNRVRSFGCSHATGIFDAHFSKPEDASRFYQLVREFRDAPAEPVRDDDPAQDEEPLLHVLCEMLGFVNRADGQSGVEYASEPTVLAHIRKLKDAYDRELDRQAADPPRPDRMTDAERALCDMCNTQEPWTPDDFALSEAGRRNFANKFNAVRDEQRAKTKGEKERPSALAEPLPSAIKGPPMTRDEYLVSARRLSPDPRTEPDPRPKCIRCAMRWTPPEGADATVTPCFDCCCVDPATEPEREREKADAAQSRVTELQSELAWAEEALHDSWRAIRFSLEGRAKMRALGALREEQEQTAKAISTRQDALVAGNHLGKELERLRAALGEIRGSVDRVERTPIDRVIEIKSILTKVGA